MAALASSSVSAAGQHSINRSFGGSYGHHGLDEAGST